MNKRSKNPAILLLFLWLPLLIVAQKPNIVWITCEDMSFHLSCFGSKVVKTPNLDALATDGIRFTNLFSVAGVCAPSRAGIITGMYPISIGAQHMRTLSASQNATRDYPPGFMPYETVPPPSVRCFPEYLRAQGYYCTNNSKEDYQFRAPKTAWDESSPKAHWRNRPVAGQPFFSVFNFTITHESQVWSRNHESLLVDPQRVEVPPIYPDVPEVRKDVARHLSNAIRMDSLAGIIIRELKDAGLYHNAYIFFYSDHGDGLPFYKREVYDRGMRAPLIIKLPANKMAGTTDTQLISFVDLAPTVLSLAGIPIPKHLQGQAFLGPQKAKKDRTYVYGARDRMDSEIDRVRAVRDSRFKYIRNYNTQLPRYQNIGYRLQQPMMVKMLEMKEKGELNAIQMRWFEPGKPAEELYDCLTDPLELNNLAEKPEFAPKLKELRKAMDQWLKKVGDKSDFHEMEMLAQMWPNKIQPITASPAITIGEKTIKITSSTPGASIAYKTGWKDPSWKVYTRPIPITSDSLYVSAHRIGYRPSLVVNRRLRP